MTSLHRGSNPTQRSSVGGSLEVAAHDDEGVDGDATVEVGAGEEHDLERLDSRAFHHDDVRNEGNESRKGIPVEEVGGKEGGGDLQGYLFEVGIDRMEVDGRVGRSFIVPLHDELTVLHRMGEEGAAMRREREMWGLREEGMNALCRRSRLGR